MMAGEVYVLRGHGFGECCQDPGNCAGIGCANGQACGNTQTPAVYRCCAAGTVCCGADGDCTNGAPGYRCDTGLNNCFTGCGDDSQCVNGYHCLGGACVTDIPDGGTGCTRDDDCASNHCDTANNETGRCCAAGECCDGIPGDVADCGVGNYCRASTWQCVDGTAGQPCDNNTDCDTPLVCTTGDICAPQIGTGGLGCNDNTDCVSGHCDLSVVGPETNRCCAFGECCDGAPSDTADCAAGNYCRASTWQCVSGTAGDPCDNNGDCDPGNLCRITTHVCIVSGPYHLLGPTDGIQQMEGSSYMLRGTTMPYGGHMGGTSFTVTTPLE
jgi:hypothetical protein